MRFSFLTTVAVAAALGGCATVTRGTTEPITVNSEPPGAEARTSLGHACPSTPCTWEIGRKSEFVVSFTKGGYEDMQIPVSTRVAGAGVAGFAGNVLVGGIVGMGVDAATGSTLEHYPNPVMATLVAKRGHAAAERSRRGRRQEVRPEPVDKPRQEDAVPTG